MVLKQKKQIHAAYSGRIPLAFHLDIFLKESDAFFFSILVLNAAGAPKKNDGFGLPASK